MRQSHQKSRSRGRNRKPQNPMSRNFESNGPDVKIRGNASHIAEKYSSLARDALSNGDTVMAENYLQHAEHYNRIVAAAQLQKAEENAANANANGRGPQPEVIENNANASAGGESDAEGKSESTEVSASAEETTAEPKERKNGRGRRTKRVAAEDGDLNGSGENPAPTVESGSQETGSVDPEVISDDAASLPQSITGGLQSEEG